MAGDVPQELVLFCADSDLTNIAYGPPNELCACRRCVLCALTAAVTGEPRNTIMLGKPWYTHLLGQETYEED